MIECQPRFTSVGYAQHSAVQLLPKVKELICTSSLEPSKLRLSPDCDFKTPDAINSMAKRRPSSLWPPNRPEFFLVNGENAFLKAKEANGCLLHPLPGRGCSDRFITNL